MRNTILQVAGAAVSRVAILVFYLVLARELGESAFGDFNFALLGDSRRHDRRTRDGLHHHEGSGASAGCCARALLAGGDHRADPRNGRDRNSRRRDRCGGSFRRGRGHRRFDRFSDAPRRRCDNPASDVQRIRADGGYRTRLDRSTRAHSDHRLRTPPHRWRARDGRRRVCHRKPLERVLPWRRLEASWDSTARRAPTRAILALALSSLPLAVSGIFTVVLSRIDVVILSFLKGSAAVGAYAAAYRIFARPALRGFLLRARGLSRTLSVCSESSKRARSAYEGGLKVITFLLTPIGIVLALYAGFLIETLYGRGFGDAITPMIWLGLGVPLWGIFIYSVYALVAADRQKTIAVVVGVGPPRTSA